ncbi:MAG: phage portal protein [Planctomycetota bacterium]|nr:MAG: phage portal protein [Planctomycetota bacterium]
MATPLIEKLDLTKPAPAAEVGGVSRSAGSFSGALSNWFVHKLNRLSESREREVTVDRADALFNNDPHASSVIDSMATNIVGTGLMPQSAIPFQALGWDPETAKQLRDQQELAFSLWAAHCADARERMPFWMMQLLTIYCLLNHGEYFRQPIMIDDNSRLFSLALQSIHPLRVRTPDAKKEDKRIRDGIRMNTLGAPVEYFVANPDGSNTFSNSFSSLPLSKYSRIPAKVAHRPGMLHGFVAKSDEQIRGVSVLAPAMPFFRNLSDYLDYELIGAMAAASFSVFIATENKYEALPPPSSFRRSSNDDDADRSTQYREFAPGGVYYGNENEKPHILKSDRPSDTFAPFVERLLRAVGASVGMPYEVIAKDFSKTNYSSARAALLEAGRVFLGYQQYLIDGFCQPSWAMVQEEAYLRGMVTYPKGTDFYALRHLLTMCRWIPPRRGHVDPKKEIEAMILAKDNNIRTLARIIAEDGGDWEETLKQRGAERRMESEEGIVPAKDPAAARPDDEEGEST